MPGGLGGAQLVTRWGGLWHGGGKALISLINLSAKLRLLAPSQPPVPGHTCNAHAGRKGRQMTRCLCFPRLWGGGLWCSSGKEWERALGPGL